MAAMETLNAWRVSARVCPAFRYFYCTFSGNVLLIMRRTPNRTALGADDIFIGYWRLRESRDWSQAELARRSGVTKSAISTYELGLRTPSADVVYAFAKVFGVSADYLLGIAERRAVEVEGLSERDEALIRELVASLKGK